MTENEKGEVWQRTEIESPCRKVCVIHPLSQLCIGCYRTAEEIRLWSSYSKELSYPNARILLFLRSVEEGETEYAVARQKIKNLI